MLYMVTPKDQDKGQLFYNRAEAEKRAGYLNAIPDGIEYVVKEIILR